MKRVLAGLTAVALAVAGCGSTPHHAAFGGPTYRSHSFGLPPKNVTQRPGLQSGVSTVTMLDSVSNLSSGIFNGLNPEVVAGYSGGSWPTYFSYAGHFKRVVAVQVNTGYRGVKGAAINCLDVEPGDASPSQAGTWLSTEVALGFRPCAYGSLSEWPAINASIAAAHVTVHVYRWDANWTLSPHLDQGFDATQWTDHYDGRNIDGSTVDLAFAALVPTKPRTICWGKGSTPRAAACAKPEANAKQDWNQYLAFHRGLLLHQKQLAVVRPYPGYFQQTKRSISVPAYKGASIGYLGGRIAAETKWSGVYKSRHDALVKEYHS